MKGDGYYRVGCFDRVLASQRLDVTKEIASEVGVGVSFLDQAKLLFSFAQQSGVGVKETECEM